MEQLREAVSKVNEALSNLRQNPISPVQSISGASRINSISGNEAQRIPTSYASGKSKVNSFSPNVNVATTDDVIREFR